MTDAKKNPAVPHQEKIEELSDAQLSQVSGGLEIPTLPRSGNPIGLKLGQAVEKPSCFTKSDDRLPSKNGFGK